ncbi:MAG: hypothetical protein ACI4SV_04760, partial [Duodenibacillus sp.]
MTAFCQSFVQFPDFEHNEAFLHLLHACGIGGSRRIGSYGLCADFLLAASFGGFGGAVFCGRQSSVLPG